jgi:hypothetical protein
MAGVVNTFTDSISISYTGNGKAVSTPVGTYTGTKDAGVAIVIAAGATNTEVDIVFTFAQIQSFVMASDQDLTVKVNSSTTPVPSIALKKTAGLVWGSDYGVANTFTADVTKFFITNAGTVDAKFNFRVLYN